VEDNKTPAAQLGFNGPATDPENEQVDQYPEDRTRGQRRRYEPPELTEIDGLIAHDQQAIQQAATHQIDHPFDSEYPHDDLGRVTAARLQDRAKPGPRRSHRGPSRSDATGT